LQVAVGHGGPVPFHGSPARLRQGAAMAILRAEGLIEAEPGKGLFVTERGQQKS
jgi:DNA-binding GntR family transcriptional regulator